jgi:type II secretory pathway predicted ATPase ExeA
MRKPPTPLRLKRLLDAHGLKHADLRAVLIQDAGRGAGKPLSGSALSQLLNWGRWPAQMSADLIRQQVSAFLHAHQVPAAEIREAFDEEDPATPERAAKSSPAPQRSRANDHAAEVDEDPAPETEMLSQDTLRGFQLGADPFSDEIQGIADVYLGADQAYIREAMWQAATRAGFVAVIGESGAGKSVLRRYLTNRIYQEKQPITLIRPASLDTRELTAQAISEAIICACSGEPPRRTREARDRQLHRVLVGSWEAKNRHVLVIEEAHDLRIGTLKLLKRYWELEAPDGFTRLLGVILIGQPELRAKLDERVHWDAREVIRRCEVATLNPLPIQEVTDYLRHKLTRAGVDPARIYAPDVPGAIARRLCDHDERGQLKGNGCWPLSVNNVLKRAMNAAIDYGVTHDNSSTGRPLVTAAVVEGL